jgi:hypothetical protein
LIHTLLTDKYNSVYFKRVLIICPKSVVFTWVAEFSKWLSKVYDNEMPFEVRFATVNVLLNPCCLHVQIYNVIGGSGKHIKGILQSWFHSGGVMLLSYETISTLVHGRAKRKTFVYTLFP